MCKTDLEFYLVTTYLFKELDSEREGAPRGMGEGPTGVDEFEGVENSEVEKLVLFCFYAPDLFNFHTIKAR